MCSPPDYKNRDLEEIIGQKISFDSVGHFYRAVSLLDYFDRTHLLTSLLYSSIEARMGIEHLLFEQLVLSVGLKLSQDDYERCLNNRMKFEKLIQELSPDYEKLQQFTGAVLELTRTENDMLIPELVFWRPRELMKDWGKLSKYLHWFGSRTETTDNSDWVDEYQNNIRNILLPIWGRMSSGLPGLLHSDNMESHVRDIWTDFRDEKIDIGSAKRRLDLIRPILRPEPLF